MAKRALIEKQKRLQAAIEHDRARKAEGKPAKVFAVRGYTRCRRCGRPRAVYQRFGLCRICLREMTHAGEVPGVTKASW